MKTQRTRAVVLRRTNYSEADRILQLLTPDGRMSVMARGVRREKSKLAGGIELFAVSDVVVGQGKGKLGVLTSARLVKFYRHILDDYDRMQFAYEAMAQVTKASESLDEPEWYDIITEVLMGLDAPTVPLMLTQTWFYLHVSSLLGYELNTQRDYMGQKLDPNANYRYSSAEKGLVMSEKGEITADHIKILRLSGSKSLQVIMQVGGIQPLLSECLQVTREHAAL